MLPDAMPEPGSSVDGLVERRRVLRWSGGALGLAALGGAKLQHPDEKKLLDPVSWERFLRDLKQASGELVAAKEPQEDAYLFLLASWMLRLAAAPQGELKPLRILQGLRQAHLHRERPLFVSRFALEPGVKIPLHDHRGFAAAFVVLQGEVSLRNFESEGERPTKSGGIVNLRERPPAVIEAGHVSTLARERDNFHIVTAGEKGATGLEVFTAVRREGASAFYDLEEKPVDAAAGRFVAVRR